MNRGPTGLYISGVTNDCGLCGVNIHDLNSYCELGNAIYAKGVRGIMSIISLNPPGHVIGIEIG